MPEPFRNTMLDKFGPQFATPCLIAQPGANGFHHRSGGESWSAVGPLDVLGSPTLLVTIDLSDPRLDFSFKNIGPELPLVSYINAEVLPQRQVYRVLHAEKRVGFVDMTPGDYKPLVAEACLPVPLPERPLLLREAAASEIPTDEDAYASACDSFLGGEGFIRLGGDPLWLQTPEEPPGSKECRYVASIGCERYDQPSGIVSDDIPFYLGKWRSTSSCRI